MDDVAAKLKTAEARTQEMEEIVKKRESELRSSSKTAGDDAQGEVIRCDEMLSSHDA